MNVSTSAEILVCGDGRLWREMLTQTLGARLKRSVQECVSPLEQGSDGSPINAAWLVWVTENEGDWQTAQSFLQNGAVPNHLLLTRSGAARVYHAGSTPADYSDVSLDEILRHLSS